MKLSTNDRRLGRPRADRPDDDGVTGFSQLAFRCGLAVRDRLSERLSHGRNDRGDVSGWVLVTLMTAGLVVALWAVAGPRLEEVFNDAMDRVVGGP